MDPDDEFIQRKATEQLTEALEDTRVVVINGARQTGKSTIARQIQKCRPESDIYYLDDAATRAAAAADPAGFVQRDGLTIIDEVQRVPELILAIKHRVDTHRRPGQFLLTGSARLLAMPGLPDSLIGRSETIELFPLSQGEIDNTAEAFVAAAFDDGVDLAVPNSDDTKRDYLERALRGGFPEAVQRNKPTRRSRFLSSYTSDLINRDVSQITEIERPADLRRLVTALTASTAGLLVTNRLSSDLGFPNSTVKRYLDLLELVYAIRRVPAWSSNLTSRAISTPKLLFTDSGIVGHLAGWTLGSASNPVAPVGPLVENFVLGELARQLPLLDTDITMHHYRDRDGVEVDGILEHPTGQIIGIEIKSAATVRYEDFNGLRHLARKLGSRFQAGFVLYTGQRKLSFGENLAAVPISAVWRTQSSLR